MEKANVLVMYFLKSVFCVDSQDSLPEVEVKDIPVLSDFVMTQDIVKKKLNETDINKSSGYDELVEVC